LPVTISSSSARVTPPPPAVYPCRHFVESYGIGNVSVRSGAPTKCKDG
jgi:hypothetical protein